MKPTETSAPMLAKPSSASGSDVARPAQSSERLSPPQASPQDVLDLVRQLVAEDRIYRARQLLAEAAHRFSDDSRIRLAGQVLNEAESTPSPFVQPTAGAEIEWLKEPPEQARGKWVALIGHELVAMADSAAELEASLRSGQHQRLPVVQYVAP